jgi:hypothetical protein
MKTPILALLLCSSAHAEEFTFSFKFGKETFQVKASGSERLKASSSAASKCFQHFTNGVYQGEEKSLRIIDTCANPDSNQKNW